MIPRSSAAGLVMLFVAVSVIHADYSVVGKGVWPRSWPAQLDRFREQSTTYEGGRQDSIIHVIPFSSREDFEAAWPHLLKVRSPRGRLLLLAGPDESLGKIPAGVRLNCPPRGQESNQEIVLDLIVDGRIIDLNRIEFPDGVVIQDRRFSKEK